MLPVPTKIRAVIENPDDPFLDCYSTNDIATQVALSLASNHQPATTLTKETTTMSLNPEFTTSPRATKQHIPGIHAARADRLVETLTRLGLCPSDLAVPLKQIAASGRPIKEFYQVSIDELDRALNTVEVSLENRMAFKWSLRQAGLLK